MVVEVERRLEHLFLASVILRDAELSFVHEKSQVRNGLLMIRQNRPRREGATGGLDQDIDY